MGVRGGGGSEWASQMSAHECQAAWLVNFEERRKKAAAKQRAAAAGEGGAGGRL